MQLSGRATSQAGRTDDAELGADVLAANEIETFSALLTDQTVLAQYPLVLMPPSSVMRRSETGTSGDLIAQKDHHLY